MSNKGFPVMCGRCCKTPASPRFLADRPLLLPHAFPAFCPPAPAPHSADLPAADRRRAAGHAAGALAETGMAAGGTAFSGFQRNRRRIGRQPRYRQDHRLPSPRRLARTAGADPAIVAPIRSGAFDDRVGLRNPGERSQKFLLTLPLLTDNLYTHTVTLGLRLSEALGIEPAHRRWH